MLNMVKPKYFMPVHGEYRHLVYHSRLAEKTGIPKENIFMLEDGEILEITGEGAKRIGRVNSGRIFIDGKGSWRCRRHGSALTGEGLDMTALYL